jgi:hypothetical protein
VDLRDDDDDDDDLNTNWIGFPERRISHGLRDGNEEVSDTSKYN